MRTPVTIKSERQVASSITEAGDETSAQSPSLHPIRLSAVSTDGALCRMCVRYCRIHDGQAGFCRTVVNRGNVLYSTIYGLIAEVGIDPIEKKPVRCYRPGTRVLSVGSLGCNLRCSWCQNWEIAYADATMPPQTQRVRPQQLIATALQHGCDGIAWTYNEPSIWVDYIADCAALARAAGLYTVLVSNGLFSAESLSLLAPLIDVYRADFKSLRPDLYRRHATFSQPASVLDGIVAMRRSGVHIELVTVLMPEYLSADHLGEMGSWIRQHLGADTPWHLVRFIPYAAMTEFEPTSLAEVRRAAEIAQSTGLTRVFAGDWNEPLMLGRESRDVAS